MDAKVKVKPASPLPPLMIRLNEPGMTPLLRAGLGGLAASLRAIARQADPEGDWPRPVKLGPGSAEVSPDRITINFGTNDPAAALRALFAASFCLDRQGVIDLPGSYEREHPPDLALAVALQGALKRTFLQHGKTTPKAGSAKVKSVEIDGRTLMTSVQPYASFAHQTAWEDVLTALRRGSVQLAGWVYPGAAQRHIAFASTKCAYTAARVLCGCFALVGCLSHDVPESRGGALIIPEPSDLVAFSRSRPRISAKRAVEVYVSGPSDGVLAVHLAVRMDALIHARPGIAAVHGVLLRATPWGGKQKNRVATITVEQVPGALLDLYHTVASKLPARILAGKSKPGADAPKADMFAVTSALRGFVTENLALGRPWHHGFATAVTSGSEPRRIHQFHDQHNLGALRLHEKEGLVLMLPHLEEAELALVRAVHTAIRQRFGAIAEECRGLAPTTRNNRWNAEREKWRLAFAGAKTHAQVRGALADLWSRAGPNAALRKDWERVLPLLREGQWHAARDLALVALASYAGSETEHTEAPTSASGTKGRDE